MVGDDSGRDHFQFAGAPAIEDIDQAVIRFGDQQHYPAAVGAVAHLQSMAKRSAIAVKPGLQRCNSTARSAAVNTTRMKNFLVSVSSNCWASRMFCPLWARKVDTRGDDAGAVRAGQRQDELVIGHGGDGYNSGKGA